MSVTRLTIWKTYYNGENIMNISQNAVSSLKNGGNSVKPELNFFYWLKKHRCLYIMLIPGILYFIIFRYIPMSGLLIAFENYSFTKGVFGSEWVGLKHFHSFFSYPECWKIIRNTLLLNFYNILFAFPASIVFAVLLNEVRKGMFKSFVQTISYLPHFISTVIVVGMFYNFLSPSSGLINLFLKNVLGLEPVNFLMEPGWFRTIYNGINIWQETGWNAIIYMAALTSIDITLYEAAYIDGAGRLKQFLYVSLPGMLSTIVVMFIMRIGYILEVGFESVLLLYNPSIYETADVISTYIYRRGIIDSDYSFTTAVGLFQSIIGLILIVIANKLAKKYSETSLW